MKLKEIKAFERNGRQPFSDWFKKVKDQKTKERILTRFERIIHGNYGYH